MTTARSARFDAALAKMDAALAALRAEAKLEGMVAARPDHSLGCTLHEYHEGDCMVARPGRSRHTLGGLSR